MYLNGTSFTEICDILNTEEVPTKLKGKTLKKRGTNEYYTVNSVWMPKTIRLILSNPTYIGKIRYHIDKDDYEEFDGCHKPIISLDVWNKVQEKLSKIKTVSKTNFPKDDVYFCGTLVCGICGHKFTTQHTVKVKKDGTKKLFCGYRCINREKKLCTCLGVSHKKVEKAFLNYIDRIEEFTQIDSVELQTKDDDILKELESYRKLLTQYTNKNKEIMDLFMVNKINHEQLQYMSSEITKKQTMLEQKIKKLEEEIKPKDTFDKNKIARTLKEHWQYLSNKERLEFLTNFVEEIVIINRDKDKVNGIPEILSVKFYE